MTSPVVFAESGAAMEQLRQPVSACAQGRQLLVAVSR